MEKSSSRSASQISYEEAVEKYGNGRYQVCIFVMLAVVSWCLAAGNGSYIWIGANMRHSCITPNPTLNSSEPYSTVFQPSKDECSYSEILSYSNGTNATLQDSVACTAWTYDTTYFHSTVMSEWDINSCSGNKWQISLVGSMYMVGFLVGCFVFGDLSDRFGRRNMLFISSIGLVATGVAGAYSVNISMLIAMRFLNGVFVAGARNSAFVYLTEILMPRWRSFVGPLTSFTYALSFLLLTAMAQYLPGWRMFLLVSALINLIFVPYWWLLHESPHWLLARGRQDEMLSYFKRSAQFNHVSIPANLEVTRVENTVQSKVRLLDFFGTARSRLITFIICLNWLFVGTVTFGLSYNIGNLTGSIFTNMYISSAFAPLTLISIWVVSCSRKCLIVSSFYATAILSTLLAVLIGYESIQGVTITIPIISALGGSQSSFCFVGLYIITSELYATNMRVSALGLGSSFARAGGAIAPYIALSNDVSRHLPYIIFAVLALIAGTCTLILPETVRKELPVTRDDMETFFEESSPFSKAMSRKMHTSQYQLTEMKSEEAT